MNKNGIIEILTLEELCEALKISETIAYKLLRSGQITAFQLGNHWKIPKDSVNEFIINKCNNKLSLPVDMCKIVK